MKFKIILGIIAVIILAGGGYAYYDQSNRLSKAQKEVVDLKFEVADANKKLEEASKKSDDGTPAQSLPQKSSTVDLISKLKDLDLKQFQAVHLTSNDVYFAKIRSYNSDFVVIENIYYLQGGYRDPAQINSANAQQSPISLVKRGNELHGPEDIMTINTANILFVETMKSDS